MTRKRRMFEINLPDEVEEGPVPAKALARRGPMASAISENAEALQARKVAAQAIRDENDALAHEFVALREAGHVVKHIALKEVHTHMLVRDRMPSEDAELSELVTSIRELGLSNPIRVLPRPDGAGFELVQGFRRLTAYRQLSAETNDPVWAQIPALVMPGEADMAGLYRRMVDENVIRKDLSFAEMAYAARNFAANPATGAKDVSDAVAKLFQSAPYSKRSYIRSFVTVLDAFESRLNHPTEIPRAVGVALARAMKDDPGLAARVEQDLARTPDRDVESELEILRKAGQETETGPTKSDVPKSGGKGRTKTTFHISSTAGQVKCTAAPGRLEIKVDQDFSAIDRARLERAVADLIAGLE